MACESEAQGDLKAINECVDDGNRRPETHCLVGPEWGQKQNFPWW